MLYQRQMQKYIHLIGGGGEWFFSHQDDQNTLFWNILMKICKNFFIFFKLSSTRTGDKTICYLLSNQN